MTQKKIKEINVKGTHFDCGYRIGKLTANKIHEILDNDAFISDFPMKNSFQKNLNEFKEICKKFSFNYYQELQGISEGAGVNFDKIFLLNSRELKFLYKQKNMVGGCTTCVVKNDDSFIVGHNEDGHINNDIYLLRSKINNEPKLMSVNYYGYLSGFSVSLNEHGLYALSNYIESKSQMGVPFSFISRSNIIKRDINHAVSNVIQSHRATGQNYMFFQNGFGVNIETSMNDFILKKLNKKFVHTNHYLSKRMKQFQLKRINPNETATIFRYKHSLNLFNNIDKVNVVDRKNTSKNLINLSIKKILKNHDNFPKSICQHGFNDFKTLGSILFDTKKMQLEISYGNSCKNKYYKYDF